MTDNVTSQNIDISYSDTLYNNSIHIHSSDIVQCKNLTGNSEMFSFGITLSNITKLVTEDVQFSIDTSSTNAGTWGTSIFHHVQMISSWLWVVTQRTRMLLVAYRSFVTVPHFHLQGPTVSEDGTGRMWCPEASVYNCVVNQKNEDFNCRNNFQRYYFLQN